MLNKEIAKINWETKTAKQIKDLVRGLNPIIGAHSYLLDKKIKFWKVNAITEQELVDLFPDLQEFMYRLKNMEAGTILFAGDKIGLFIKTIEGIISVIELQAENCKKMNVFDFLRGNAISVGNKFI